MPDERHILNGRIAGGELFDSQATWRSTLRKIVQSYGLDAIDFEPCDPVEARPDAGAFLRELGEANGQEFRAIGLGRDVRFDGGGLAGAGLLLDDRVVHLVAFAQ